ncbi:glycosyltransferase family 2 protein [Flavobacterium difficile]|uniref:Glycosyltransferase family 2 protein n=1 Tax=Flavobacterium difficile TaxID=2709659 RepID=A0ABX0I3H0_9FLAO|nr:glycosyltransferase family 2 protein [Flavobacterium difficile]NHM01324.1 glycosyltransferase family 2 protein [Flavobacterium difficile]
MNKLSVIIVNYKGWNALEECLNSLKFYSEEISLEVIVVDNCSNDGQFEVFKENFSNFKFILNSGNNGFANGCNLGAANASSDYYLFLNPDTKVDKHNLESFFKAYVNHQNEIAVLSCLQIDENGKLYKQHNLLPRFYTFFGLPRAIYKWIFKNKIATIFQENDTFLYPEWITGAVVLLSKKWFDKVSGWNEDFWMYMEDVDLCKRISDANGKIAVYKKATIFHKHGGASRINITTKALTKTEVIISKHSYIQNNFSKFSVFLLHTRLIFGVLLEKLLFSIIALPLFFIPKLQVNKLILKNYFSYLFSVVKNNTFISPRATKFTVLKS